MLIAVEDIRAGNCIQGGRKTRGKTEWGWDYFCHETAPPIHTFNGYTQHKQTQPLISYNVWAFFPHQLGFVSRQNL